MKHSVYSFSDNSLVINSPGCGSCTITGEGVGSIGITRATDVSQHDAAADGSIMTSKIKISNGTLAISVQQTSYANVWLRKWYNYLMEAPTPQFTETSAVLKSMASGEQIEIVGITPQKRPDLTYQVTGQQVTWNLLAVEINE